MIKNKRDLAIALNNGGKVEMSKVSKRLFKTVDMWVSYKDCKIENGFVIGTY